MIDVLTFCSRFTEYEHSLYFLMCGNVLLLTRRQSRHEIIMHYYYYYYYRIMSVWTTVNYFVCIKESLSHVQIRHKNYFNILHKYTLFLVVDKRRYFITLLLNLCIFINYSISNRSLEKIIIFLCQFSVADIK